MFHNFHIPRISPCVTPKYITKIPFITLHEIHFRKSIALKSKGCPPTLTIIKINTSSKETYFSVKIVDSHLKSPLEYCKRKKKRWHMGRIRFQCCKCQDHQNTHLLWYINWFQTRTPTRLHCTFLASQNNDWITSMHTELVCRKIISSTSLRDYFCGDSQREKEKEYFMQALKVTKLEILSRTVTLTTRQFLSDEWHRTNVQQWVCVQSQKNMTVLMQLKPVKLCRAVSLPGLIIWASTTAAMFNLL